MQNGSETSFDEIFTCFENEKENIDIEIQLEATEIGILIQELFKGEVVTKRKLIRFNNAGDACPRRIRIYQNLRIQKFKDIPDFLTVNANHCAWNLLQNKDSLILFNKVTNFIIGGNRLTIDLAVNLLKQTISSTGLNGNTVREYDIGILPSEIQYENLSFVLYYMSKLQCCIGFIEDEKSCQAIHLENDPLCFKTIVSSPSGKCNNVVSKNCKLYAHENFSLKAVCCFECSKVKKRLQNRKLTYANLKRTKNCLLGREDLEAKLKIFNAEKSCAKKRIKYWQDRFNNENIQVDIKDDEDLRSMFGAVDEAKVPEGFELLLSQQRKALAAKGSSGRRWHPK